MIKHNSVFWTEKDPKNLANYNHSGHKLFFDEATVACLEMIKEINKYDAKFSIQDNSSQKATWMLYIHCLTQIKEVLKLIKEERIISSGPLLREILEKHYAILFLNDKSNGGAIKSFFEGEHYDCVGSKYTNSIKDKKEKINKKAFYQQISHLVHPNYHGLKEFFNVGGENNKMMWFAYGPNGSFIPPIKISQHYWILAQIFNSIISDKQKIINWIKSP